MELIFEEEGQTKSKNTQFGAVADISAQNVR